jgi:transposase-like protein
MQSDFEAKHIRNAKEALSEDLNIAKRHLNNYKEIEKELLNKLSKEASLWQKISNFFSKYF